MATNFKREKLRYSVLEIRRHYQVRFKNVQLFQKFFSNKEETISKIANFLGIESFDMDKVIEGSSVKNTMERRRKKFAEASVPFREIVCYRKGEIGSWREELSDEVKELFLKKCPNLQP